MPSSVMEEYNEAWGEWIRTVCLTIILLRGGLHLDFKNKGFIYKNFYYKNKKNKKIRIRSCLANIYAFAI